MGSANFSLKYSKIERKSYYLRLVIKACLSLFFDIGTLYLSFEESLTDELVASDSHPWPYSSWTFVLTGWRMNPSWGHLLFPLSIPSVICHLLLRSPRTPLKFFRMSSSCACKKPLLLLGFLGT